MYEVHLRNSINERGTRWVGGGGKKWVAALHPTTGGADQHKYGEQLGLPCFAWQAAAVDSRLGAHPAAGGVFRDVTDRLGLQAAAQTLAAGNLAGPAGTAPAVAQVTSQGVVLFAASAAAAMSRQSSGQLGAASGSDSASASGLLFAWQPPAGSVIGAAAVAEVGVLAFCTGATRQLCALLPAGGGSEGGQPAQQGQQQQQPLLLPQLVQAAALRLEAEVSCASNLVLPGHLQGPGQLCCGVFAVGTYASQVLLLELRWDSQRPQHASLVVLRRIDLAASSLAGSLPGAAAAAAAAAASPLSPRSFQREQLTPESLLLLSPSSGGSSGCSDASELAKAAAAPATSLVVGLRTGSILQLRCSLGGQGGEDEELLALSLSHMPAVLLPLPPPQPAPGAAAPAAAPPVAAVLSDRVCLLRCAPEAAGGAAGRVRCQRLGLAQVQAAAPLLLDGGGLASSSFMLGAAAEEPEQLDQQQGQQQPFLLCASADGCLRLVALDTIQLGCTRSWPLPHRLQPSRVAVHAASGGVLVAGCAPTAPPQRLLEGGWEEGDEPEQTGMVVVVDPSSGEGLRKIFIFLVNKQTDKVVALPAHVLDLPPRLPGTLARHHMGMPIGLPGPGPCLPQAVGGAHTTCASPPWPYPVQASRWLATLPSCLARALPPSPCGTPLRRGQAQMLPEARPRRAQAHRQQCSGVV